jgi:predicted ATPase/DNA-binding winged helix-turn-helix (wHTH) protein
LIPTSVRFGDFELIPHLRRLEDNGSPVDLSSRAIDILCLLVERPGQVVTKRELLERVWPDVIVDEGSIRFHVAALRRVLGDGEGGVRRIATIPGRGYCFVGMDAASEIDPARTPAPHGLPHRPGQIVGREGVVEALDDRLAARRFVTLVGAGGIGKTTVALLAAHHWLETRRTSVTFVDLGAVTPDSLDAVAGAVAAALGLSVQSGDPLARVVEHLRGQSELLVLDTCEAAIDGAARLAEAVFAATSEVRVLATSREALRVEGEWVHRLEPLAQPDEDATPSAAEALRFPAVQLFVQRAAANQAGFELRDEDAPVVGAICRDLGGVALAIELAAGRVEAYGVAKVAELLSTEFALTWPGRRTAAPRLQTLNATLNWSYELLTEAERTVFRRLAVFVGVFSLEAGLAVAVGDDLEDAVAVEGLSSLVGKSLLSPDGDGGRTRFRMLDPTRAYARSKLTAHGEDACAWRRHAQHYLHRLPEAGDREVPDSEWPELTGNVRAALEWGFADGGDADLAVQLATRAAAFWLSQGLFEDARRWSHLALDGLDAVAPSGDTNDVRTALAGALIPSDDITPQTRRRWEEDYAAAQASGDLESQLTGLVRLAGDLVRNARYRRAQEMIESDDVLRAKKSDPVVRIVDNWIRGLTSFHLGDQAVARGHLERLLRAYSEVADRAVLRRIGYDIELGALMVLGSVLSLMGAFQEAEAAGHRALAKPRRPRNAVPPSTAMWRGLVKLYFIEEDDREIDRLTWDTIEAGRGDAISSTVGIATAFRGLWLGRQGDRDGAVDLVDQGLAICEATRHHIIRALVRAELALQIARHGGAAATGIVAASDLFAEPDPETWCTAEILRIRGAIAECQGHPALAEDYFRQGFDLAERQGATVWALRNALGLAALWLAQGRAGEEVDILTPLLERFRPDNRQPDVRRARALLEACRAARVNI